MNNKLQKVILDTLKLLSFQSFKLDASIFNWYLSFGILFTWLCGIGRYWDNPKADLWQYWGLGSVIYIFVLAFILWLLIMPLKPNNWSYKNILLFVSLTSPPAILYAIPVERFTEMETAQTLNVWFLAIVASWRVALLFRFLTKVANLSGLAVVVATLLPLTLIVSALTALNLEHAVFEIMAGLQESEQSQNDAAYVILVLITVFSVLASPLLLVVYLYQINKRRKVAAVELATIKNDFWELRSGEKCHAENPDTFWIPKLAERESLNKGVAAKLIFDIESEDEQGNVVVNGERMYVIVSEVYDDYYIGLLDAIPATIEPADDVYLDLGAEIVFKAEHIIDIGYPPEDYVEGFLNSIKQKKWYRR